jgi:hypothetical protein
MKLRDHPGVGNWPPNWLSLSGAGEKKLTGEVGVLTDLKFSTLDPITILYLTIQVEEEPYMGTLLCKDNVLCQRLNDLLQKNRGKPIKEIGSLFIPK